jgi:hypothetical protein
MRKRTASQVEESKLPVWFVNHVMDKTTNTMNNWVFAAYQPLPGSDKLIDRLYPGNPAVQILRQAENLNSRTRRSSAFSLDGWAEETPYRVILEAMRSENYFLYPDKLDVPAFTESDHADLAQTVHAVYLAGIEASLTQKVVRRALISATTIPRLCAMWPEFTDLFAADEKVGNAINMASHSGTQGVPKWNKTVLPLKHLATHVLTAGSMLENLTALHFPYRIRVDILPGHEDEHGNYTEAVKDKGTGEWLRIKPHCP